MSKERKFSAGQLLGEGIRRLGREELIALALEICADAADCGAEFHGNIHPGNISRGEGGAALGPRADHEPGDWSTDELEYMAPELFWNGTATAAADVYSIGLLLFAGVTGGLLPFFKRAPENMTNEMRASALRRRMNGDEINIPAAAGEKLGPVMAKCLRFEATERYADTKELAEALRPCVGEGDAKAMEMFGKPERELSEVERMMAGILARLEPGVYAKAQDLAVRAHRALGCRGCSRSDFIVSEDGPVIIETNNLPGMTPTSLFPDEARHVGIEFADLVRTLVELALERAGE